MCEVRSVCGQLILQLFFVSGGHRLPLETCRAAAPNVWQENHDSFNTGGHDAPFVRLLRSPIVDLHKSVPVGKRWCQSNSVSRLAQPRVG